jgi:hypothetical protein
MAERKQISDALAEYEARYTFAREITLPVEDQLRYSFQWPQGQRGEGYRWFKSPNVICLEKVRRLKQQSDG